jgi:hypothetical protein
MTEPGGGTIRRGLAPKKARGEPVADAAGNARRRGEDPSPDGRGRGEVADGVAPADLESTRERAS